MGLLAKMRKAAEAAGRVGDRLPTTEEIVYGKKPKARPKRATKRRRH